MAKQLQDTRGFEYDWIACDASWQAGFFSTAGGGYAPNEFREDTDACSQAIDEILAAPATTRARFTLGLTDRANTWWQMAERGIFAYDSDFHGGPYRLVAVPEVAASLADLPAHAVAIIRRVHFQHLRFAGLTQVTGERLASR